MSCANRSLSLLMLGVQWRWLCSNVFLCPAGLVLSSTKAKSEFQPVGHPARGALLLHCLTSIIKNLFPFSLNYPHQLIFKMRGWGGFDQFAICFFKKILTYFEHFYCAFICKDQTQKLSSRLDLSADFKFYQGIPHRKQWKIWGLL